MAFKRTATAADAANVDNDPPSTKLGGGKVNAIKGKCIVYWMRMSDLRVTDNRALSMASVKAKTENVPVVAVFVLSPQDYIAHDRSPRRIDFTLRNLAVLKETLAGLHIPLHTFTHSPRRSLPSRILSFITNIGSTSLFANIEYEIDELRRDIRVSEMAKEMGVDVTLVHNKCIIEPGVILNKEKKAYAVYSPYQKHWMFLVNKDRERYTGTSKYPEHNSISVRESEVFGSFFDTPVPVSLHGFELGKEDRERMAELWPEGEQAAQQKLDLFINSLVDSYHKDRDSADRETTSRLSVYLSSGVLSARACVRAALDSNCNNSGVQRWLQELAWRDFYTCVLAGYPRVSMGRPFLEKYANVVWEPDDGENVKRWKEGNTGVPIVDAAMRCLVSTGWMHNRLRMIVAMFLVKDLMVDWKVGERYFMQQLIDGDLASNNGGWQWSASTGADPCPYFRVFNPYTQSWKADPSGDFIRRWVPELEKLRGQDLHKPSATAVKKLGYVHPIVEHGEARLRALRRFKNPGEI